jgi:hypothetical protein
MAIGRVPGPALLGNLDRQGTDLSFTTSGTTLVYMDFANFRFGIGNTSPTHSLTVNGDVLVYNGTANISNLTLFPGALFDGGANKLTNILDPALAQDAATKAYVDSLVGNQAHIGNAIPLGSAADGSLTTDGAYISWTPTTYVTDAIDDLNEVMENIRNDTYVKSTTFTADVTSGGAGTTVTLTITSVGNPNRYDITWGDGTVTTATTDSTPTHTYATNTGSPFDVTVRAYNNGGSGTGSEASLTREDYITIYTADPVVSFAIYANSVGGSAITTWDDGDTVYLDNNTTNIGGATIQYTIDWGDSQSDTVITDDTANGGSAGSRLSHTFDTATEQEQSFTVRVTLDSHSTALPSAIPTYAETIYKVYDTHTPTVALDDNSGINEEGTAGHVVTFTNNTESTIGSYATYGTQYQYQWGDGTSSTTVNVGSGADGDTGGTIAHTFALSGSDQAAGTAVDYTGNIRVISTHTSSPFVATDFTVHVEPDVRSIIAGTAVTVSDRSADNQYDLYDIVTYDGDNLALVRMTNTSQNADDYVYNFADGTGDISVTEDGSSPGSIGAVLDHDFTGISAGTYNLTFTADGTPDITAQTDTDTGITFTVNATPAAPNALNTFSLSLADTYQGTSPKLAAGAQDESASSPLSAGAALTTSTARRYTSGTIDTNVVNNAYNGVTGTLTAVINGSDSGNKTFTAATGENGTFTSLVVSGQDDAHTTISASTYPTGLYQTFDAKITQALASYDYGVNDERLSHSTTGVTNYVSVVYDNVTATPTIESGAGTLAEGTGGTKRYVSGIPYYNSGSPTVVLSGTQVNNLTGQAYSDVTNPVEIDSGTNQEGTSSAGTTNTDYSYATIDGSSTMLTGGIPNANVGVASAYTLGSLTIPVTASSVRTVDRVQVRARNCNGVGSYVENATNINVHTASQSGISEILIPVSDSLGAGFDDDGVRIFDFSADTTNTPSYTGSTNFYTATPYTESSDPGVEGTKEATVRLGVLKYDITDYSAGFLPVGPDRSGDTGTQYFTFAFRRTTMANFDLNITSAGIAGLWIAAPGTAIDAASGLNGWIKADTTYGGSGVPGSNTGAGGNGSDGCAFTSGDRIATSTALSGGYTMTLGSENGTNATGNVILVRIALTTGQSVTAISVGVAS